MFLANCKARMNPEDMHAHPENLSDFKNNSCDIFIFNKTAKVLFPMFYLAILIIGLMGNLLVLYIIFHNQLKVNSTRIYLVNLALSDTLFALALPGRIVYNIREFDWPFGDFLCRINAVIIYTNTYVGIGLMTCLSIDRYLAMVHPHHFTKLRSVGVVKGICVLIWFVVFCQTAPMLFHNMVKNVNGKRLCMEYFGMDGHNNLPYLLLLACAFSYGFPLVIIISCYVKINHKLHKAAQKNTMSGKYRQNRRASGIIFSILMAFILCFSPYHINLMQFMIKKLCYQPSCEELKNFKISLQVTLSIMNLNSTLDPVIYFFAVKSYKQKVMSLLKSHLSAPGISLKTTSESVSNS
ncbi:G-protein coupled receptor 183-like [Erpetoichthys calabaricus]|uniref:G-protein coupled receptor 183-like n=1 Tax=Erpetoichthys calabaricus TaxID=27687 RepID=UPI0010A00021|nr:G-protein coupled receptor 183-like [Erpetoichthys calabaricus]